MAVSIGKFGMAGFLDKQSQVIDMILTSEGRRKNALGKLNFAYWAPFDNEIDYDPYISTSGSLNPSFLSSSKISQIEECLIGEAVTGHRYLNLNALDETNVKNPLFTISQGQTIIPKIVAIHRANSFTLEVKQQKITDSYNQKDSSGNVISKLGPIDRGYNRFNSAIAAFEYQYTYNSFPIDYPTQGFLIRVFKSGSDGMVEVKSNSDLNNETSYSNDLKLTTDLRKASFGIKVKP